VQEIGASTSIQAPERCPYHENEENRYQIIFMIVFKKIEKNKIFKFFGVFGFLAMTAVLKRRRFRGARTVSGGKRGPK